MKSWLGVVVLAAAGCAHQQKVEPTTLAVTDVAKAADAPQLAMTQPAASGPSDDAGRAALQQALSATRVYFDFDDTRLNDAGQASLQQVAKVLRQHPAVQLRISGHCDERGTEEYNLMLGQRRAEVARKYLEDLGVGPRQLDTISFGDERPVAEGHSPDAWSKNRRDELSVMND